MEKIKNIYQTKNYMLSDAFDRIVAQIHLKKQKDNLTTFAICGTQPGVGTTSVAINLAISMAQAGWKTLLIDADLRKIEKLKHLNEAEDDGLAEYLNDNRPWEDVTYKTNYKNLFFMPAGAEQDCGVREVCSVGMQELISRVEKEYDYVIIDVPALSAAVDGSVIASIVNGVVMVTSQRRGCTIQSIRYAKRELDRVEANVLGIIVNQVDSAEYRRSMRNYDYFKKKKYITTKKGAKR